MLPVSRLPDARFIRGHTRPDYLRDETLVDIFRETARRVPDKLALTLIGRGESLTYAELDRRSDLVAAALAARVVTTERSSLPLLNGSPGIISSSLRTFTRS